MLSSTFVARLVGARGLVGSGVGALAWAARRSFGTSDEDIARAATMSRIRDVASSRLGIAEDDLYAYGPYKAKLRVGKVIALQQEKKEDRGKLILVTAMSPTKAGEGKTCTAVGLADGLAHIGKDAIVALREPSLGPVFGVKGGAAGGG